MKHLIQYTILTNFIFLLKGGAYIPAAICTAGYTVATINNSFDRDLHGLVGFLDSPVSKTYFLVVSSRSEICQTRAKTKHYILAFNSIISVFNISGQCQLPDCLDRRVKIP